MSLKCSTLLVVPNAIADVTIAVPFLTVNFGIRFITSVHVLGSDTPAVANNVSLMYNPNPSIIIGMPNMDVPETRSLLITGKNVLLNSAGVITVAGTNASWFRSIGIHVL